MSYLGEGELLLGRARSPGDRVAMFEQRLDIRCDWNEQKIIALEAEISRLQRADRKWQYWRTWFVKIYGWLWRASQSFPWTNDEPQAADSTPERRAEPDAAGDGNADVMVADP